MVKFFAKNIVHYAQYMFPFIEEQPASVIDLEKDIMRFLSRSETSFLTPQQRIKITEYIRETQIKLNEKIKTLIVDPRFQTINTFGSKVAIEEINEKLEQQLRLYSNNLNTVFLPLVWTLRNLNLDIPIKYIIFNQIQAETIDATLKSYSKNLDEMQSVRIDNGKKLNDWFAQCYQWMENNGELPTAPDIEEFKSSCENIIPAFELVKYFRYDC